MAKKTQSTIMKTDKKCKPCVRFRSEDTQDKVATALYLMNPAYEALGKPDSIKVSVEAA